MTGEKVPDKDIHISLEVFILKALHNFFFLYTFRLKDDLNSNVTHAMSQINKRYFNNDLGPKSIVEFQNQFGKLYTDSIYSSVVHLFSLKVIV